ncbi:hypothetical protein LINPERHAP2_LOCUS13974 [Linum perenne]
MDGYEFATTASRKRSRVIPRRGDAKDDSDAAATPPSGPTTTQQQKTFKSAVTNSGDWYVLDEGEIEGWVHPVVSELPHDTPSCPRIRFTPEEHRSFVKPWSKALVVKVIERNFSYGAMKRRLESLWAKHGQIQVSDLSNAFFAVRFSDKDDYSRAAFEGPWKIFDYYITVLPWSPDFKVYEPIRKILTWVRLPDLPLHFFNHLAVSRIGSYVGKTFRVDMATADGERAKYARVCVEIDLDKPLLGRYDIDGTIYKIVYESLETICVSCGHYGHLEQDCHQESTPMSMEDKAHTPPAPETDHGGWMIAGRRERRKPTHMLPQQGVEMATPIGSRFSALADATEDGPKAPAAPAAPAAEPVAPTQPTNTAPNQNQSVPAKQRRRGPKKGAGTGVVKITQAKDGAAQSPGAATSTGLPKHGPGRPRKEPTATPGIMNQNQQPEFPAGWEVLFGSGDRDLQGSLPKSSQITKILQKDVRIETAEPMQETPTPPTITCQPTSQLDSGQSVLTDIANTHIQNQSEAEQLGVMDTSS